MRTFAALAAVTIIALLAGSVALQRRDTPEARPRILRVEVMNASAVDERMAKSRELSHVYVVEGPMVRLLERVEGLERLDLLVSINSRANMGHFPGRNLGRGYVVIEVDLPDIGSHWSVPGPGANSPIQTVTIDGEQVFVLQVTGDAGSTAAGHRLIVQGPPILIRREQ